MSDILRLAVTTLLVLGTAVAADAQAPADPWNDDRALELVRRGIERRSTEVVDTALRSYAADAQGYVYFLLDAPELDRQTLVRTDQVAVQLFWRAPNQVRQRIVGLREQRELPITRLYYYLDRLTVVQDNYGQAIVIADGDNVNDVPHPVGIGADAFYDYRLTDSLTLRLPGVPDPVRVHEIQVRPRDPTLPAVVGTIFLEGTTGAVVRMNFTFTPSAYVDPRLDFINVTLENGLWGGRFWLPYEQRLEIRREMPELDLPFGTLIRTRMRIGDYRFNEETPDYLFASPNPISVAPLAQRQSFPFEEEIDAEWRLEGIGQPVSVGELRREARDLLGNQLLSGLPGSRFSIGAVSDVFRYNRAEGLAFGFGVGLRAVPGLTTRVRGGWAFGADHPTLRIDLAPGNRPPFALSAYLNRVGDVGGTVPGSGALNTVGALFLARDWSDPYFASGASATVRRTLGGTWSLSGTARAERQRSARLVRTLTVFRDFDAFRAVRPIDPGDHLGVSIAVRREMPAVAAGWWSEARLDGGRLDAGADSYLFGRGELDAGHAWSTSRRRARLDLSGRIGGALGELPRQELILIGGRGTLPGYPHRAFAGDRFAIGSALASADLTRPWLRARAFGAVGWTGLGSAGASAAALWNAPATGGLEPTLGIGLGLFYDIFQLDVARGLGAGGRTQVILEVRPEFWGGL